MFKLTRVEGRHCSWKLIAHFAGFSLCWPDRLQLHPGLVPAADVCHAWSGKMDFLSSEEVTTVEVIQSVLFPCVSSSKGGIMTSGVSLTD